MHSQGGGRRRGSRNNRGGRHSSKGRGQQRGGHGGGGSSGGGGGRGGGGGGKWVRDRGNSSRGRGGRTNRGGRGGRGGRHKHNRGKSAPYSAGGGGHAYRINNLPNGTQYKEIVSFLKQNLPQGFQWIKLWFHDGNRYATINVAPNQSSAIQQLQGNNFKGAQISISRSTDRGQSSNQQSGQGNSANSRAFGHIAPDQREHSSHLPGPFKGQLKQFIQQAYDADHKALAFDTIFQAFQGQQTQPDFHNKQFLYAINNTIKAVCPQVVTISFANCHIQTLSAFNSTKFHKFAPDLQHLSLSNNEIADLKELDHLGAYKQRLRELILATNPFGQNMDPLFYHHIVSMKFPNLTSLDKNPIQPLIDFNLPSFVTNVELPLQPQGSYFDSQQSTSICKTFVDMYFACYDSDKRDPLLDAYSDNAMFSLSLKMPRKFDYETPVYAENNRNFTQWAEQSDSKDVSQQRLDRLHQRKLHIASFLDKLPRTKHNLEEFVADSFVLGSTLLHLGLQGEFAEVDTKCIRRFHRTFVLTPTGGSSSRWPAVIVSDQLYIGAVVPDRSYIGPATTTPLMGPSLSPQQPTAPLGMAQPANVQQQMALQLAQQTNCDPNTAASVLQRCNWNYDAALQFIASQTGQ